MVRICLRMHTPHLNALNYWDSTYEMKPVSDNYYYYLQVENS